MLKNLGFVHILCCDLHPPNYLKLFINVFAKNYNIFLIFQMLLNVYCKFSLEVDNEVLLKVLANKLDFDH